MGNLKEICKHRMLRSGYNRANLEYAPMTSPESTLPSLCRAVMVAGSCTKSAHQKNLL